jgi:hypothetical protein
MSELSPRYSGTGFLEQALSDSITEENLTLLLEELFTRDYDGDTSIPLDASTLALCHGIVEHIWIGSNETTRQAMFTVFYRSLEFGYNVSAVLKPPLQDITMDIETVFLGLTGRTSEDIASEVYERGAQYLFDRPVLSALVERDVT